jgi:hypothetical protein
MRMIQIDSVLQNTIRIISCLLIQRDTPRIARVYMSSENKITVVLSVFISSLFNNDVSNS